MTWRDDVQYRIAQLLENADWDSQVGEVRFHEIEKQINITVYNKEALEELLMDEAMRERMKTMKRVDKRVEIACENLVADVLDKNFSHKIEEMGW